MKKIVLCTHFLFSFFFSFAQAPSFEWVENIGGLYDYNGKSICVDTFGNTYTVGAFYSTIDADPGVGVYNLTSDSAATFDIFVTKIDSSGNFIWAKRMGGKLNDFGYSITVASSGNIYLTGSYRTTADFDPGSAVYNITAAGGTDMFVLKLNSSGDFIWVKSIGGVGSKGTVGYSIAVDSIENVYTTGYYAATVDFDPGVGVVSVTSPLGTDDIFISKLDSLGNFVFVKTMTAMGAFGKSIEIDAAGNIISAGYFNGTPDFNPGPGVYNLTAHFGGFDSYILKLDANGNFIWAKSMGGASSYANAECISVDAFGNVFTIGYFYGTVDFNTGAGTLNLTAVGYDVFISKLNSTGNFVWAKQIGGNLYDIGNSIDVDKFGNIFITGQFEGTVDLDPGAGVVNFTSFGLGDIFVSKLDSAGNFLWAGSMGGSFSDNGVAIVIDSWDNIFTTGIFQATAEFDPGAGVFNLSQLASGGEVFVHKMSQKSILNEINENLNENTTFIYPNPSNNFIDIETTIADYSLSIFDVMGKIIFKEKVYQNKIRVDVSDFSDGIYFIHLANGDMVVSKKFIKE